MVNIIAFSIWKITKFIHIHKFTGNSLIIKKKHYPIKFTRLWTKPESSTP